MILTDLNRRTEPGRYNPMVPQGFWFMFLLVIYQQQQKAR